MRMREPVLTPEQAAAARRGAALERERSHAAAEERRAAMLQVCNADLGTHCSPLRSWPRSAYRELAEILWGLRICTKSISHLRPAISLCGPSKWQFCEGLQACPQRNGTIALGMSGGLGWRKPF